MINFANLFYYSAYFLYYLWVSLNFLVLFMGSTILFQLNFTFIYSIFSKISRSQTDLKYAFGMDYFCQLTLLFSLFLLLLMGLTALFRIIHWFHCIISTNFYLYLQHFQQKNFNFSKLSGSQTDIKLETQGLKI